MASAGNNDAVQEQATRLVLSLTPQDLKENWDALASPGEVVGFYGHGPGRPYREFSNFYDQSDVPFEFVVPEAHIAPEAADVERRISCNFSEKAIMLCKAALFGDVDTYKQIVACGDPATAKALGRKVRGFQNDVWTEHVCSVAYQVVYQKFAKTPSLQPVLLGTGDKVIAEATVNDTHWGIGLNVGDPKVQMPPMWRGTNLLGWALMQARSQIRQNSGGDVEVLHCEADAKESESRRAVPEQLGPQGLTPVDLRGRWNQMTTPTDVVGFYSNGQGVPYREFSNFYDQSDAPFEFVVPEVLMTGAVRGLDPRVPCDFSEKAIMLCKAAIFGDADAYRKIVACDTPRKTKSLGRQVKGFDNGVWAKNVCLIAFQVVYQKFAKSPHLQPVLLGTGERILAEATVNDANWGIGLNVGDPQVQTPSRWKGTNLLGWALMEARSAIRQNSGTVMEPTTTATPRAVADVDMKEKLDSKKRRWQAKK